MNFHMIADPERVDPVNEMPIPQLNVKYGEKSPIYDLATVSVATRRVCNFSCLFAR